MESTTPFTLSFLSAKIPERRGGFLNPCDLEYILERGHLTLFWKVLPRTECQALLPAPKQEWGQFLISVYGDMSHETVDYIPSLATFHFISVYQRFLVLRNWKVYSFLQSKEWNRGKKERKKNVITVLISWAAITKGFPGGTSGKEPACQCRRHKWPWFNPWVGKMSWRRAWQPMSVFLTGESHG